MKKLISIALVLFMLISFAACGSGNDPKTYTFTLMFLADGNIVQRANYSVGDTIFAPASVEKEGYTFKGWAEEIPLKMPARDVYINAVFERNSYTISYYVDDILAYEAQVLYGDPIPGYDVPDDIAASFSGWDVELPGSMPANDVVLHGYSNAATYLLTYKVDGKVYKADVYREGAAINAPEAPETEGYTFAGWNGLPEIMPGENVTVEAILTANVYTIVYLSEEGGESIGSASITFGTSLSVLSHPEPEAPEGKALASWSGMPDTMPAHDVTVFPVWKDAEPEFTISYYVGETLYLTQKYTVGSAVTAPADPDVEDFLGWAELPGIMPDHDVTVKATFAVPYLLAFYADGDTLYVSMQLTVGTPLSVFVPKDPQRSGYRFIGWDTELPDTMPANDLRITAKWEKEGFLLTIYDGNPDNGGKLVSSALTYEGTALTYPELVKEGFTLYSWNDSVKSMPGHDLVLYPIWEANTYTLTYVSSLDETVTVDVKYGEIIAPLAPEHYGYRFDGWMGLPETMPAHDVTVVAVWTEIVPDPVTVMVDLSTLGNGETYTITVGGTYTLSGIASNAKILIDSRYPVTLKLKNAYLTCAEGNAIECVSEAPLIIQALTSSVSVINSKNGGIVSASDLTVTGNGNITFETKNGISSAGTLTLDINGSYVAVTSDGAGLSASGDLNVLSGRFSIEAADTAISSGNDINISGGETIASSENGKGAVAANAVSISGGKLLLTAAGKGLTAASVTMTGGTLEITSADVGITSQGAVSFRDAGVTVYSGGVSIYALNAFDAVDSDTYLIAGGSAALPPSYHESGNRIPTVAVVASSSSIVGGRFEATSTQYAFETSSLIARGAKVKLTTAEDAIFVSDNAEFTDTDLTIRAGLSFKNVTSALTRGGIVAYGNITISGGSVNITSLDNCITAKNVTALGTDLTFDTSATAVSVSDRAIFGASTVRTERSSYGISAGEIEFRITDADITSENSAVSTVKTASLDGSITVTGGEIMLNSSATALLTEGGVTIDGGLLLAFSRSSSLPAAVYSGTPAVNDGTFAAFGLFDTDHGTGLVCALDNTVKKDTLLAIRGGNEFLVALYARSAVKTIHLISSDMKSGYPYEVITGGKYADSDTVKILTGGTYTAGTTQTIVVCK